MAVLPFSLTGVVLAFTLHGLELSLIALIGILGLLGVLVNDSLVLIAHLNKKRGGSPGLSDEQVARGAAERLRPIVITSATTLAALAPAAYGLAGSHPFMTPMIMAIAWGVAFGAPVTLVLLPCLYAAHQDAVGCCQRLVAKIVPSQKQVSA
jgi:multidrug efflux pump subunit AcrB